ncbi:response regulator [Melittangium boletus]|uniref:Chemotaxis protein CheY n=1 Tax=Melittangium boletus DSM 14713 TaxID=1294270 RepID=A0A250I903_9BACT|nr:response regulator [Melittangium boletus]ATB28344.1 chemotaxis protein CheY [Melittangium boletus DSM 14713]
MPLIETLFSVTSGLNVKILLVEDNEDIREGLTDLLESEGYSVVGSGSAEEGLEQLRTGSFQLVITDYMLPGENGGWMLEQAGREQRLRDTPAVMITAHPRVKPPEGVRLVHKPLDIDDFLQLVDDFLHTTPRAAVSA